MAHSFNNKPLMTAQDFLDAYEELGKLLFDAVNPTQEEIGEFNDELTAGLWEDMLCVPLAPKESRDPGMIAAEVFASRGKKG